MTLVRRNKNSVSVCQLKNYPGASLLKQLPLKRMCLKNKCQPELKLDIAIAVHSLPSNNELNQRCNANITKKPGNPNTTLGLTSSVIFVQHKEKCLLYSLWIILHIDTKLPTTQSEHTLFLSLFRANVPSVSTQNIITATCTQKNNYIITR